MFLSNLAKLNKKNHLEFDGCDVVDLAIHYGTPLVLMSETHIENAFADFKTAFNTYQGKSIVAYASKAFICKEMCKLVAAQGGWLDVVSGGELFTAMQANFPMSKIFFHGNNKSLQELEMAIINEVGYIVIDNFGEIETLNELAKKHNKIAKVLFRIKPGVDSKIHAKVQVGKIDSKFGFALETGEAFEAVKAAAICKNLEIAGLHCHIGSNIHEAESFSLSAKVMLTFAKKLHDELNINIEILNLGGGFGIKYLETDEEFKAKELMIEILAEITKFCNENGMNKPTIAVEPGRYIAGPAGMNVYTIGNIKTIPNIRDYVAVDGSMCDNPRPALYGAKYTLEVANRANLPKDYKATVSGRLCETDTLHEDVMLQKCQPGDTLAVFSTGAYGFSMAMTYNRLQRPAVVFVKNGESRLAIKRETYEQILQNDV